MTSSVLHAVLARRRYHRPCNFARRSSCSPVWDMLLLYVYTYSASVTLVTLALNIGDRDSLLSIAHQLHTDKAVRQRST